MQNTRSLDTIGTSLLITLMRNALVQTEQTLKSMHAATSPWPDYIIAAAHKACLNHANRIRDELAAREIPTETTKQATIDTNQTNLPPLKLAIILENAFTEFNETKYRFETATERQSKHIAHDGALLAQSRFIHWLAQAGKAVKTANLPHETYDQIIQSLAQLHAAE